MPLLQVNQYVGSTSLNLTESLAHRSRESQPGRSLWQNRDGALIHPVTCSVSLLCGREALLSLGDWRAAWVLQPQIYDRREAKRRAQTRGRRKEAEGHVKLWKEVQRLLQCCLPAWGRGTFVPVWYFRMQPFYLCVKMSYNILVKLEDVWDLQQRTLRFNGRVLQPLFFFFNWHNLSKTK